MKSMDDLPHDLVEEILSRVPMTSLDAIRSTCKLWYALSKDPSFKHCGKAAKEIMAITVYEDKACLMSVNLHNHKDLVDPFIKQIGKLKDDTVRDLFNCHCLFHCNGLLLYAVDESKKTSLVVWNPYTSQTRWIESRNDYYDSYDTYGMGYDRNNNQKILKFPSWPPHGGYEIYDFKSNSWRVLDVTINWQIYGQGVSLKGNNYFLSGERDYSDYSKALKECLQCFDFTRERFWGVPLPCSFGGLGSLILSVVSEEKLALLSWREDALEMEISITNKIDESNVVSWSYFLKFDQIPTYRFRCLHDIFFVDEKKKVAVICVEDYTTMGNNKAYMVREGGHYREVNLGVSFDQPLICSYYVPSSVQIQAKTPAGGGGTGGRCIGGVSSFMTVAVLKMIAFGVALTIFLIHANQIANLLN